jgi:hypothetical protein
MWPRLCCAGSLVGKFSSLLGYLLSFDVASLQLCCCMIDVELRSVCMFVPVEAMTIS